MIESQLEKLTVKECSFQQNLTLNIEIDKLKIINGNIYIYYRRFYQNL